MVVTPINVVLDLGVPVVSVGLLVGGDGGDGVLVGGDGVGVPVDSSW